MACHGLRLRFDLKFIDVPASLLGHQLVFINIKIFGFSVINDEDSGEGFRFFFQHFIINQVKVVICIKTEHLKI